MDKLSNELLDEVISNLTEDVRDLKKHDKNDMLTTATSWLIFLEELKEYRKAEEQGLLRRLPCKEGDTVWCLTSANTKAVECTVLWIELHRNGSVVFSLDGGLGDVVLAHLGKTWFISKEDAEEHLVS